MNWRSFQALQKLKTIGQRFISYVQEGSGDPVVLIHGIPTWGYLWHQVLPDLAKDWTVFVPDLIGFGFSDRSDRFDRSIAVQTDILIKWMNAVGIQRAAIVGHDIGGGIALRLATLYPDRVSHLCIINAVCYDSWPIELMLQLGHPETYRKLSASSAMKMLRQAIKGGFSSSPRSELLEGLLAPYSTEVGKLSLIRDAAALNTNQTTEITPLLSRISAPTLILWGEDDKFQPVRYGERLALDIPGSKLVRIKRAGHFAMFDQTSQTVHHLADFLRESSRRVA